MRSSAFWSSSPARQGLFRPGRRLCRRAGEELAAWQPILNLQHLHNLVRGGVEIWDYQSCYVDPTVRVGRGTVLMPGTILRGGTTVGENCVLGPNTLLENVTLGDGVPSTPPSFTTPGWAAASPSAPSPMCGPTP